MTAAPPHDRRSGSDRREQPRPGEPERRHGTAHHRRVTRVLPLVLVALFALAAGAIAGARHESAELRTAKRFLAAWERRDYARMYGLVSARARSRTTRAGFVRAYERAANTTTLDRVLAGRLAERAGGRFVAPVEARTRRFGAVRAPMALPVETTGDAEPGVAWTPRLVFPGLRPGEQLARDVDMPPRGTLETRDGQVLAEGADRSSDLGAVAAEITGAVGPIPAAEKARYAALGYPDDARVGLTGLERQFEQRLAGTFGGRLRAGRRVLAAAQPRAAGAVRTSIDPDVESAAITALAGRFGGIAVLRPRTGEVLALSGIGFSAPQPPGSTFKIVTLAGALDAGVVKPRETFPVQTAGTLAGVELQNANGEACGGSLEESFAESCNSVFAPMGARLGARRLVAAAERFGFNEPDGILGAPPGSIPPAAEIGDDLAVGASAIGQGRVLSTPLRQAQVAAAIANGGRLVRPTLLRGDHGRESRATTVRTAHRIRRYMRAVVEGGTGSAAAIPGVPVAGKTGTAELRDTSTDDPTADPSDTTDTDAWFVAFAPVRHPQVAVAVLLVGAGAGGATAAPAARVVLDAAVRRRG
jgi:hypothetical protein